MKRQLQANTFKQETKLVAVDKPRRLFTRSDTDHPVTVIHQGTRLPECRIRNYSDGGLFLEYLGHDLEMIVTPMDLKNERRNQALIQIPHGDDKVTPPFSLVTRVAYVTSSGLGVAFLTKQDKILKYLQTIDQRGPLAIGGVDTGTASKLAGSPPARGKIIRELQSISEHYLIEELPHFFSGIKRGLLKTAGDTDLESDMNKLMFGVSTIMKNQDAIRDKIIDHILSDLSLQSINARDQKLFYAQKDEADLELVNKEEFEEWVVIIGITHTVEGWLSFNLLRLHKAFSCLSNAPVDNETNPLAPYSILWLLNDLLDKLGLEFIVKKATFRLFRDTLLTSINHLYEELLSVLSKQGISDTIDPSSTDSDPSEKAIDSKEKTWRTNRKIKPFDALSSLLLFDQNDQDTFSVGSRASNTEVIHSLKDLPRDSSRSLVSRIEEHLTKLNRRGDPKRVGPEIRKTIGAAERLMGEVQNDQLINDDLRNLVKGLELSL
ncbi:MAG: DUF1631 domain-containing protein, partial [Gammaproteobacteria bacterium]|nr:DUF1631 domain-containing protein [Gammaproteobacteria bacterium]